MNQGGKLENNSSCLKHTNKGDANLVAVDIYIFTEKENLKVWFSAGATCVGMGSQLITKVFIADKNYDGIRELTTHTIELIQDIRK